MLDRERGLRFGAHDLNLGAATLGRVAERILVYGVTGSGKTVLAARISAATGLPWHAVDDLTWEPGWIEVPYDEQRRRITEICAGERWVLDAAYGRWLEIPLSRVELIVALDFPRWLSLARLLRRSVARSIDGRPICNGNRESFGHLFSKDSIVGWHFRSFARKRRRMREWEADPTAPAVVRFIQPRQVQVWLRALAASGELRESVRDPGT
jgi:adenylate kinase family enzyme